MSDFEFPTNVRQIGSIGSGLKIYMEDYVSSYLQQYAASGGYDEKLAFLIGRSLVIDNAEVLFISGAVSGKHLVEAGGILTFGSMSFDYAKEQINSFFESQEIVGQMLSQPGYGTFLNANYAAHHMEVFKKPYQVIFVVDPIEKTNSFYAFDKAKGEMTESRGYFIYYEKNTGMHEYMLQNKENKTEPGEGGIKIALSENFSPEGERRTQSESSASAAVAPYLRRLKEPAGGYNRYERHDKGYKVSRNVVNLLSGLCAVLVLVCVVMGASLVQNDERITSLEGQLTDINTLYKNALAQNRNSQPVFAQENETYENAAGENAANESEVQAILTEVLGEEAVNTMLTDSANSDNPIPANNQPAENNDNTGTAQNQDTPPNANPEQNVPDAPQSANPAVIEPEQPQTTQEEDSTNTNGGIPETYTVQEGDNLNYISIRFYGNTEMVERIMEANGIDNPDTIFFGKMLILPRL
ncbi:MAG: LysM peptidoglycan-binding domain-containing protein [Clostridiales bacterium]|jgi:hypothetical protein|nr:LysM peptidoglycan-binding domain-containing protein [Clostridiales bacterium]